MSNNFVGLLLNSFSDIFKFQKYYITSLLGKNIFASQTNMFTYVFIYRWEHLQIISQYNYHNSFIGLEVFTCLSMFLAQKYLPQILHNLALDFSNVLPSIFALFISVTHLAIIKIYFCPLLIVSFLF